MKINELNQNNSVQLGILAQNVSNAETKLSHTLKARQFKLRWVLAVSCLPLFGIYAAFGIAPQTIVGEIETSTVIEALALPDAKPVANEDASTELYWYKDNVRRDDTLNSLLSRLNVRNHDVIDYIRNDAVASEITKTFTAGKQIEAQSDNDGNLITLEYQLNATDVIVMSKTDDGYQTQKISQILDVRPILKSAKISSSLFGATDDANIPDHVAIQIADIFESDIDFHTDLRRGDRFNVIYEGSYHQGELLKTGDVMAVELVNNGKTYRAVGFRDENNVMQYFSPEGKSLHKSFLRSPLEFSRVSSGFNLSRFHPVLQKIRAHKGTDFAAPTGTRVKASGDAVVDFVGQKGGYGNVVVLKHANGVSTVYGHLSRFSANLRRGSKVAQGEIIGFVGMTGTATGPHLHYEFLVNGEHRDPMKVALPKANSIATHQMAAFNKLSEQLSAQLSLLNTSNLAALE